ncbi:MAG: hypothetical protein AAGI22_03520 [Planctomycetota bacterium]
MPRSTKSLLIAAIAVLAVGLWFVATRSSGPSPPTGGVEIHRDAPSGTDATEDMPLARGSSSTFDERSSIAAQSSPDAPWGLVVDGRSGTPIDDVKLRIDGLEAHSRNGGRVSLPPGTETASDVSVVDPRHWVLERVDRQRRTAEETDVPVFVAMVVPFREGTFLILLVDEATEEPIPFFGVEIRANREAGPSIVTSDDDGLVLVPERFGIHAVEITPFDGDGVREAWSGFGSRPVAPDPAGVPSELRLPVGPTYPVSIEGCGEDERSEVVVSLTAGDALRSDLDARVARRLDDRDDGVTVHRLGPLPPALAATPEPTLFASLERLALMGRTRAPGVQGVHEEVTTIQMVGAARLTAAS